MKTTDIGGINPQQSDIIDNMQQKLEAINAVAPTKLRTDTWHPASSNMHCDCKTQISQLNVYSL